jgi:cellulose biosynthesis protein BcsQ
MKTVAIISQKGGAGKTTIAVHLAVAAERRSMKTAIFDLDPQASASSWSDKRKQPFPAVLSAQAARLPNLLELSLGASKPATYGRFKTSHPSRVVTVIVSTMPDGLSAI